MGIEHSVSRGSVHRVGNPKPGSTPANKLNGSIACTHSCPAEEMTDTNKKRKKKAERGLSKPLSTKDKGEDRDRRDSNATTQRVQAECNRSKEYADQAWNIASEGNGVSSVSMVSEFHADECLSAEEDPTVDKQSSYTETEDRLCDNNDNDCSPSNEARRHISSAHSRGSRKSRRTVSSYADSVASSAFDDDASNPFSMPITPQSNMDDSCNVGHIEELVSRGLIFGHALGELRRLQEAAKKAELTASLMKQIDQGVATSSDDSERARLTAGGRHSELSFHDTFEKRIDVLMAQVQEVQREKTKSEEAYEKKIQKLKVKSRQYKADSILKLFELRDTLSTIRKENELLKLRLENLSFINASSQEEATHTDLKTDETAGTMPGHGGQFKVILELSAEIDQLNDEIATLKKLLRQNGIALQRHDDDGDGVRHDIREGKQADGAPCTAALNTWGYGGSEDESASTAATGVALLQELAARPRWQQHAIRTHE